jgi:replicative DNA helicase
MRRDCVTGSQQEVAMKLSKPVHRLKDEAKRLSRDLRLPLHAALDRVAASEGFARWSLLAARASQPEPAAGILARLQPGDLLLIGARPGQGKTLMGLRLAIEAMRLGRRAFFFTLEYTEREVRERLDRLGADWAALAPLLEIDASDAVSADHIVERLASAASGDVAVIDYLQLLDQRRENPGMGEQVRMLRAFARARGLTIAFLSQIDRRYDPAAKELPDMEDIRLPNPLDLGLFDKACFLGNGQARFLAVA